jgi:hypothetical protein
MTKKTLKQTGRVKSIEIQISYEEFHEYLKSQKLDTLVEWLNLLFHRHDETTKLLEFICSIHFGLEDHQKINAYLGLNTLMKLEGFQVESETSLIYLDFREDEECVEFKDLGVTQ